ncbi:MAG: alpha-2-macroglobulin family protein, partial [Polyangiaceae bacterium]
VSVDPDKPAFIRGDKATFTTRGDYLFGAPMSGGKVHYTITREYSSFLPPGAEGMVVDDEAFSRDRSSHSERGGEFQAGDGDLSAKGDLPATIPLPMPHQTGPETVTFESEVEDISRQSIAGRASALVHPGEFYVALRPPKEMFVPKGAPIVAAVAAIEPSGKKRAGVPVGVDLVRRTWETVVESHGDAGGSYQSKVTDKIVGSCNVSTTAALTSCNLMPAEAGYYVLHAHGRDARGNELASSTSLYVVGDANDIGWSMQDAAKLELVSDKKTYEIGDTATILVKNPFKESTAIVTLERAGIYKVERHTLIGAMPTLSFPVTADMAPNTFVSVEIVRGRSKPEPAKGADVGQPTYRLGYAEIVVDPESRRLHLTVTPQRTDYRPGDTVEADIVVNDGAGKGVRSNVTFYAVDEGVLMLTGYQTPDPIPALTGLRSLNVFALETRDDLAKVFLTSLGNAGADKGAEGGGGGGMATRQDFRTTAYFEPSIVAENGKAHVRFKLPDSLTTYRLMAVAAAEDDRFGYADSHVTTSRKLMARPEMPRFLRAGDSIDAGIIVTSKGLAATNVEVAVKAEGVELRGNPTKVIALPANGSVEVRFPFVAARAGHASFTFTAKAGGEADSVQIARTVEVPLSLEAVALYGETKDAAGEKLGDLKSMRDDVGGLEVTLASTALVGLQDGVEQLLDYPYGCTEQLTSRMVPFVAAASLGKDGAITLPKNLDAIVNDAIGKIVKNQRDDGGFGYWVDSPRSIPFLSAYTLWGLHEANEHKYAVPRATLDDATAYLHKAVTQHEEVAAALAERAFELDVLAEVGTPDPGETNDLYAERDKLPLFARALLAHAMAVTKMDVKERAVLLQDIDNHLRVTGAGAVVSENLGDEYARLLDSTARTTALVMRALLADDPKSALAGRLAKGLLAMRKGGSWATTQETAWALVALDEYRKAQESAKPDFDANVFLGDTKIFGAPFH